MLNEFRNAYETEDLNPRRYVEQAKEEKKYEDQLT
jgi:hypothetical protein